MNLLQMAGIAAALLLSATAQAQSVVAFVDVNVVTMQDERVLPRRTVLVRDGRVDVIGAADSVAVPEDAERIPGGGAYLMPGLVDMHAHPVDPLLHPMYLSYGVTTVQYLNAFEEVMHWRTDESGPRVETCAGPIIGVHTAEEARRTVAEHAARGFHCIKVYDDVSAQAYAALAAEARERGMRAVGHIPRNLGWRDLLAARPAAVAHAEEFLYSPIESQAEVDSIVGGMRDGGIALITTLTNYDLISRQRVDLQGLLAADLRHVPAVERRTWVAGHNRYLRSSTPVPTQRRLLGFQRTLVRRMAQAGVPVLLGTDAGNNFVLAGASAHDELAQLVRAGLTPYQALRAATAAPAAFLGTGGGRVAAGAPADLLLVLGNPLDDVANAGLIAGVMRGGRWLSADSLQALRAGVAAALEPEAELVRVLEARGLDAALAWLQQAPAPSIRPRALNELAYQLWKLEDRLPDALRVFEANARIHPEWAPGRESLAEARAAVQAGP
ncbi:amidohydrolase family protein [Longimicrobium sp.]|uniref:amidohydrolase family protein n=1 Tax=Longimicrobium sp. TaxID=2029185 RepID=UPI003B3A65EA